MIRARKIKKFTAVLFSLVYLQVNVAWAGVPFMPLPAITQHLLSVFKTKKVSPQDVFVFHWNDARRLPQLPEIIPPRPPEEIEDTPPPPAPVEPGPVENERNADEDNGTTQETERNDAVFENDLNNAQTNEEVAEAFITNTGLGNMDDLETKFDKLNSRLKDGASKAEVKDLIKDINNDIKSTGKSIDVDSGKIRVQNHVAPDVQQEEQPAQTKNVTRQNVNAQMKRAGVTLPPLTQQEKRTLQIDPGTTMTKVGDQFKLDGRVQFVTEQGIAVDVQSLPNGDIKITKTNVSGKDVTFDEIGANRQVVSHTMMKAGASETHVNGVLTDFDAKRGAIYKEILQPQGQQQQAAGQQSEQQGPKTNGRNGDYIIWQKGGVETTFRMDNGKVAMTKMIDNETGDLLANRRGSVMQATQAGLGKGVEAQFEVVSGPQFNPMTRQVSADINVIAQQKGETRALEIPDQGGSKQAGEKNKDLVDENITMVVNNDGTYTKVANDRGSKMAANLSLNSGQSQQVVGRYINSQAKSQDGRVLAQNLGDLDITVTDNNGNEQKLNGNEMFNVVTPHKEEQEALARVGIVDSGIPVSLVPNAVSVQGNYDLNADPEKTTFDLTFTMNNGSTVRTVRDEDGTRATLSTMGQGAQEFHLGTTKITTPGNREISLDLDAGTFLPTTDNNHENLNGVLIQNEAGTVQLSATSEEVKVNVLNLENNGKQSFLGKETKLKNEAVFEAGKVWFKLDSPLKLENQTVALPNGEINGDATAEDRTITGRAMAIGVNGEKFLSSEIGLEKNDVAVLNLPGGAAGNQENENGNDNQTPNVGVATPWATSNALVISENDDTIVLQGTDNSHVAAVLMEGVDKEDNPVAIAQLNVFAEGSTNLTAGTGGFTIGNNKFNEGLSIDIGQNNDLVIHSDEGSSTMETQDGSIFTFDANTTAQISEEGFTVSEGRVVMTEVSEHDLIDGLKGQAINNEVRSVEYTSGGTKELTPGNYKWVASEDVEMVLDDGTKINIEKGTEFTTKTSAVIASITQEGQAEVTSATGGITVSDPTSVKSPAGLKIQIDKAEVKRIDLNGSSIIQEGDVRFEVTDPAGYKDINSETGAGLEMDAGTVFRSRNLSMDNIEVETGRLVVKGFKEGYQQNLNEDGSISREITKQSIQVLEPGKTTVVSEQESVLHGEAGSRLKISDSQDLVFDTEATLDEKNGTFSISESSAEGSKFSIHQTQENINGHKGSKVENISSQEKMADSQIKITQTVKLTADGESKPRVEKIREEIKNDISDVTISVTEKTITRDKNGNDRFSSETTRTSDVDGQLASETGSVKAWHSNGSVAWESNHEATFKDGEVESLSASGTHTSKNGDVQDYSIETYGKQSFEKYMADALHEATSDELTQGNTMTLGGIGYTMQKGQVKVDTKSWGFKNANQTQEDVSIVTSAGQMARGKISNFDSKEKQFELKSTPQDMFAGDGPMSSLQGHVFQDGVRIKDGVITHRLGELVDDKGDRHGYSQGQDGFKLDDPKFKDFTIEGNLVIQTEGDDGKIKLFTELQNEGELAIGITNSGIEVGRVSYMPAGTTELKGTDGVTVPIQIGEKETLSIQRLDSQGQPTETYVLTEDLQRETKQDLGSGKITARFSIEAGSVFSNKKVDDKNVFKMDGGSLWVGYHDELVVGNVDNVNVTPGGAGGASKEAPETVNYREEAGKMVMSNGRAYVWSDGDDEQSNTLIGFKPGTVFNNTKIQEKRWSKRFNRTIYPKNGYKRLKIVKKEGNFQAAVQVRATTDEGRYKELLEKTKRWEAEITNDDTGANKKERELFEDGEGSAATGKETFYTMSMVVLDGDFKTVGHYSVTKKSRVQEVSGSYGGTMGGGVSFRDTNRISLGNGSFTTLESDPFQKGDKMFTTHKIFNQEETLTVETELDRNMQGFHQMTYDAKGNVVDSGYWEKGQGPKDENGIRADGFTTSNRGSDFNPVVSIYGVKMRETSVKWYMGTVTAAGAVALAPFTGGTSLLALSAAGTLGFVGGISSFEQFKAGNDVMGTFFLAASFLPMGGFSVTGGGRAVFAATGIRAAAASTKLGRALGMAKIGSSAFRLRSVPAVLNGVKAVRAGGLFAKAKGGWSIISGRIGTAVSRTGSVGELFGIGKNILGGGVSLYFHNQAVHSVYHAYDTVKENGLTGEGSVEAMFTAGKDVAIASVGLVANGLSKGLGWIAGKMAGAAKGAKYADRVGKVLGLGDAASKTFKGRAAQLGAQAGLTAASGGAVGLAYGKLSGKSWEDAGIDAAKGAVLTTGLWGGIKLGQAITKKGAEKLQYFDDIAKGDLTGLARFSNGAKSYATAVLADVGFMASNYGVGTAVGVAMNGIDNLSEGKSFGENWGDAGRKGGKIGLFSLGALRAVSNWGNAVKGWVNPGGEMAFNLERVKAGATMGVWEVVFHTAEFDGAGSMANPLSYANGVGKAIYSVTDRIGWTNKAERDEMQKNFEEQNEGKSFTEKMTAKFMDTFLNISALHPFFGLGRPGVNPASKPVEMASARLEQKAVGLSQSIVARVKDGDKANSPGILADQAKAARLKSVSSGLKNFVVNPINIKTFEIYEHVAVHMAEQEGLVNHQVIDASGQPEFDLKRTIVGMIGFLNAPIHAGPSGSKKYYEEKLSGARESAREHLPVVGKLFRAQGEARRQEAFEFGVNLKNYLQGENGSRGNAFEFIGKDGKRYEIESSEAARMESNANSAVAKDKRFQKATTEVEASQGAEVVAMGPREARVLDMRGPPQRAEVVFEVESGQVKKAGTNSKKSQSVEERSPLFESNEARIEVGEGNVLQIKIADTAPAEVRRAPVNIKINGESIYKGTLEGFNSLKAEQRSEEAKDGKPLEVEIAPNRELALEKVMAFQAGLKSSEIDAYAAGKMLGLKEGEFIIQTDGKLNAEAQSNYMAGLSPKKEADRSTLKKLANGNYDKNVRLAAQERLHGKEAAGLLSLLIQVNATDGDTDKVVEEGMEAFKSAEALPDGTIRVRLSELGGISSPSAKGSEVTYLVRNRKTKNAQFEFKEEGSVESRVVDLEGNQFIRKEVSDKADNVVKVAEELGVEAHFIDAIRTAAKMENNGDKIAVEFSHESYRDSNDNLQKRWVLSSIKSDATAKEYREYDGGSTAEGFGDVGSGLAGLHQAVKNQGETKKRENQFSAENTLELNYKERRGRFGRTVESIVQYFLEAPTLMQTFGPKGGVQFNIGIPLNKVGPAARRSVGLVLEGVGARRFVEGNNARLEIRSAKNRVEDLVQEDVELGNNSYRSARDAYYEKLIEAQKELALDSRNQSPRAKQLRRELQKADQRQAEEAFRGLDALEQAKIPIAEKETTNKTVETFKDTKVAQDVAYARESAVARARRAGGTKEGVQAFREAHFIGEAFEGSVKLDKRKVAELNRLIEKEMKGTPGYEAMKKYVSVAKELIEAQKTNSERAKEIIESDIPAAVRSVLESYKLDLNGANSKSKVGEKLNVLLSKEAKNKQRNQVLREIFGRNDINGLKDLNPGELMSLNMALQRRSFENSQESVAKAEAGRDSKVAREIRDSQAALMTQFLYGRIAGLEAGGGKTAVFMSGFGIFAAMNPNAKGVGELIVFSRDEADNYLKKEQYISLARALGVELVDGRGLAQESMSTESGLKKWKRAYDPEVDSNGKKWESGERRLKVVVLDYHSRGFIENMIRAKPWSSEAALMRNVIVQSLDEADAQFLSKMSFISSEGNSKASGSDVKLGKLAIKSVLESLGLKSDKFNIYEQGSWKTFKEDGVGYREFRDDVSGVTMSELKGEGKWFTVSRNGDVIVSDALMKDIMSKSGNKLSETEVQQSLRAFEAVKNPKGNEKRLEFLVDDTEGNNDSAKRPTLVSGGLPQKGQIDSSIMFNVASVLFRNMGVNGEMVKLKNKIDLESNKEKKNKLREELNQWREELLSESDIRLSVAGSMATFVQVLQTKVMHRFGATGTPESMMGLSEAVIGMKVVNVNPSKIKDYKKWNEVSSGESGLNEGHVKQVYDQYRNNGGRVKTRKEKEVNLITGQGLNSETRAELALAAIRESRSSHDWDGRRTEKGEKQIAGIIVAGRDYEHKLTLLKLAKDQVGEELMADLVSMSKSNGVSVRRMIAELKDRKKEINENSELSEMVDSFEVIDGTFRETVKGIVENTSVKGSVVFVNESGLRALDYKAEESFQQVDLFMSGFENFSTESWLQALARVDRGSSGGAIRTVVLDMKVIEATLAEAEKVDVELIRSGRSHGIFEENEYKDLLSQYRQSNENNSNVEMSSAQKLELAAAYVSADNRARSANFFISEQTSVQLLKQPLQAMIAAERSPLNNNQKGAEAIEKIYKEALANSDKSKAEFGAELQNPLAIGAKAFVGSAETAVRFLLQVSRAADRGVVSKSIGQEARLRVLDIEKALKNVDAEFNKESTNENFSYVGVSESIYGGASPAAGVLEGAAILSQKFILPNTSLSRNKRSTSHLASQSAYAENAQSRAGPKGKQDSLSAEKQAAIDSLSLQLASDEYSFTIQGSNSNDRQLNYKGQQLAAASLALLKNDDQEAQFNALNAMGYETGGLNHVNQAKFLTQFGDVGEALSLGSNFAALGVTGEVSDVQSILDSADPSREAARFIVSQNTEELPGLGHLRDFVEARDDIAERNAVANYVDVKLKNGGFKSTVGANFKRAVSAVTSPITGSSERTLKNISKMKLEDLQTNGDMELDKINAVHSILTGTSGKTRENAAQVLDVVEATSAEPEENRRGLVGNMARTVYDLLQNSPVGKMMGSATMNFVADDQGPSLADKVDPIEGTRTNLWRQLSIKDLATIAGKTDDEMKSFMNSQDPVRALREFVTEKDKGFLEKDITSSPTAQNVLGFLGLGSSAVGGGLVALTAVNPAVGGFLIGAGLALQMAAPEFSPKDIIPQQMKDEWKKKHWALKAAPVVGPIVGAVVQAVVFKNPTILWGYAGALGAPVANYFAGKFLSKKSLESVPVVGKKAKSAWDKAFSIFSRPSFSRKAIGHLDKSQKIGDLGEAIRTDDSLESKEEKVEAFKQALLFKGVKKEKVENLAKKYKAHLDKVEKLEKKLDGIKHLSDEQKEEIIDLYNSNQSKEEKMKKLDEIFADNEEGKDEIAQIFEDQDKDRFSMISSQDINKLVDKDISIEFLEALGEFEWITSGDITPYDLLGYGSFDSNEFLDAVYAYTGKRYESEQEARDDMEYYGGIYNQYKGTRSIVEKQKDSENFKHTPDANDAKAESAEEREPVRRNFIRDISQAVNQGSIPSFMATAVTDVIDSQSPMAQAATEAGQMKARSLRGMAQQLQQAGAKQDDVQEFMRRMATAISPTEVQPFLEGLKAEKKEDQVKLDLVVNDLVGNGTFRPDGTREAGALQRGYFGELIIGTVLYENNLGNDTEIDVMSRVMGQSNPFPGTSWSARRPYYQAVSSLRLNSYQVQINGDTWDVSQKQRDEEGNENVVDIAKISPAGESTIRVDLYAGQSGVVGSYEIERNDDNSVARITATSDHENGFYVGTKENVKDKSDEFLVYQNVDGEENVVLESKTPIQIFTINDDDKAVALAQFFTPQNLDAFDASDKVFEANPEADPVAAVTNEPVQPSRNGQSNGQSNGQTNVEVLTQPTPDINGRATDTTQPSLPQPIEELVSSFNPSQREDFDTFMAKYLPKATPDGGIRIAVMTTPDSNNNQKIEVVLASVNIDRNGESSKDNVVAGSANVRRPGLTGDKLRRTGNPVVEYMWDGENLKPVDSQNGEVRRNGQLNGSLRSNKRKGATLVDTLVPLALLVAGVGVAALIGSDPVSAGQMLSSFASNPLTQASAVGLGVLGLASLGRIGLRQKNKDKPEMVVDLDSLQVGDGGYHSVRTSRGLVEMGFAEGAHPGALIPEPRKDGKEQYIKMKGVRNGNQELIFESELMRSVTIAGDDEFPTQVMQDLVAEFNSIQVNEPQQGQKQKNVTKLFDRLLNNPETRNRVRDIIISPLVSNQTLTGLGINQVKIDNNQVTLGDILDSPEEFKDFVFQLVAYNAQSISTQYGLAIPPQPKEEFDQGIIEYVGHTHPESVGLVEPSAGDMRNAYAMSEFMKNRGIVGTSELLFVTDGESTTFYTGFEKGVLTVDKMGNRLDNEEDMIPYQNSIDELALGQTPTETEGNLARLYRVFSTAVTRFFGPKPQRFFDQSDDKAQLRQEFDGLVSTIVSKQFGYQVSEQLFVAAGLVSLGVLNTREDIIKHFSDINIPGISLDVIRNGLDQQLINLGNQVPQNWAPHMRAVHGTTRQFLAVSAWPAEKTWIINKINKELDLRLLNKTHAESRVKLLSKRSRTPRDVARLRDVLMSGIGIDSPQFLKRLREKSVGIGFFTVSNITKTFSGENTDRKAQSVALELLKPVLLNALTEVTGLKRELPADLENTILNGFQIKVVDSKDLPQSITLRKGRVDFQKGIIEIGIDSDISPEEAFFQAIGVLTHELAHTIAHLALGQYAYNGLDIPTVMEEAWVQFNASAALRHLKLDLIADAADLMIFKQIVKMDEAQGYFAPYENMKGNNALLDDIASRNRQSLGTQLVIPLVADNDIDTAGRELTERGIPWVTEAQLGAIVPLGKETKLEAYARLYLGTRKVRLLSDNAERYKDFISYMGQPIVELLLSVDNLGSQLDKLFQQRLIDLVVNRQA